LAISNASFLAYSTPALASFSYLTFSAAALVSASYFSFSAADYSAYCFAFSIAYASNSA
jgi:hypothetical protein